MRIHSIKNRIFKIFSVIAIAVLLEFLVFNFSNVFMLLDPNLEKNVSYTLDNMDTINWEKNDETLVSGLDPMLILSGINQEVRSVEISVDADQSIKSSTIFYINNQVKYFSEQGMVIAKGEQGKVSAPINKYVKDLRIDLVENAGLVLYKITVIINPAKIQISFYRIITIILIYFATIGLFKLQKSPDYQIDHIKDNPSRRE